MTQAVDRRSIVPDRATITEEAIRKVVDLAAELGPRRPDGAYPKAGIADVMRCRNDSAMATAQVIVRGAMAHERNLT